MHPRDFDCSGRIGGDDGDVTVRWLGTAGYELSCDGTTLLIDPYLTRASLWRLLREPLAADREAIGRAIGRADAIFVSHGHFDHLLDVPAIAAGTGAVVYGSRSTANVLRASGLPPHQIVTCRGGEMVDVGPFKVTMTPSLHSRFAFGRRVPYAGEIPYACTVPLRARDYRCGNVFGIAVEAGRFSLYHLGSANLDEEAIGLRGVDLLLMTISGRHATDRFVSRALRCLRPRILMPTHYDNFFKPATPDSLLPLMRFGQLVEEAMVLDKELVIGTLPVGGSVRLG